MGSALLVGLEYSAGRALPGSIVDLFLIYTFLTEQGVSPIHVMTDLVDDPSPEKYYDVITKGGVNANLLGFITMLKEKKEYHHLNSSQDLITMMKTIRSLHHHVVYFTGHGDDTGFLFPIDRLPWQKLHHIITSRLGHHDEALVIIDTCHGYDFQLAYSLDKDKDLFIFHPSGYYSRAHLVVISSRSKKAAATPDGSFVTASLVKHLRAGKTNYLTLHQAISRDLVATQTLRSMQLRLGIYASSSSHHNLWSWISSK